MLKTITLRKLNHLLQNNGQKQLWASTLKKTNALLHSTYLGVMKKLLDICDKQCLSRNYRDYLEFTFEYGNIIIPIVQNSDQIQINFSFIKNWSNIHEWQVILLQGSRTKYEIRLYCNMSTCMSFYDTSISS